MSALRFLLHSKLVFQNILHLFALLPPTMSSHTQSLISSSSYIINHLYSLNLPSAFHLSHFIIYKDPNHLSSILIFLPSSLWSLPFVAPSYLPALILLFPFPKSFLFVPLHSSRSSYFLTFIFSYLPTNRFSVFPLRLSIIFLFK